MSTNKENKPKRLGKQNTLPEKLFISRPSVLTNVLEENKYLYNLILCLVLLTVVSSSITNYQKEKKFYIGSKIIKTAFRNIDVALMLWACLFLTTLFVYAGFMSWAVLRRYIKSKLWDLSWLMLCALYYLFLLYYACKTTFWFDLGIASSFTILLEATRFLMKTHAFVRSNCVKYLDNTKNQLHPKFFHYIYFSFAPTLLYKDSYPRSNQPIRWKYVLKCFMEMILGIILCSILFEWSFQESLKDCGLKPLSWFDITIIFIRNLHFAIIFFILFFFTFFHCYLNAFAEMLSFSDRLFYKEWWASTTTKDGIKSWNNFVHSWLYTYIYKEFYDHIFPGNKTLARLMVFLLSILFHEFIICLAIRVYIPTSYVYMTVALIIIEFFPLLKNPSFIWSWISIGVVMGGQITFLTAEYFAKANCAIEIDNVFDHFKIRFLNC